MIDDSKFIYISFVSDTLGHVLTRCLSFSKDVFWIGADDISGPSVVHQGEKHSPAHFENYLPRPHYNVKEYDGVELDLKDDSTHERFKEIFEQSYKQKEWYNDFINSGKYLVLPCHADPDIIEKIFPNCQIVRIQFNESNYDMMFNSAKRFTFNLINEVDDEEKFKEIYYNDKIKMLTDRNNLCKINLQMSNLYPELNEQEYKRICNELGITENYKQASQFVLERFK